MRVFWTFQEGRAMLAGAIIGAGFLVLPYIALKAGISTTLFWILILGIIVAILHEVYGEIVGATEELHRLPGYTRFYLGKSAGVFADAMFLIQFVINLVIYLILAEKFLSSLLPQISPAWLLVGIWFLLTMSIISDIGFAGRVGLTSIVLIAILFFFIFFESIGKFHFGNLLVHPSESFFLPYGPVLFALLGPIALPEIAKLFRKEKIPLSNFRGNIFWVTFAAALFYALFVIFILGASGNGTTVDAISGLAGLVGPHIITAGKLLGFFAVITAYLINGISFRNTLVSDFKITLWFSALILAFLPIIFILMGFQDFFQLIRYSGAILGTLNILLMLFIYHRLKKIDHREFILNFHIPKLVLIVLAIVFIAGGVLSLALN